MSSVSGSDSRAKNVNLKQLINDSVELTETDRNTAQRDLIV